MSFTSSLGLDAFEVIDRAVITPLMDHARKVSSRMLKRVLNFFASFQSGKCWLTLSDIATRLQHSERTIRASVRVLVAAGLLKETGARGRRTRSINWPAIERKVRGERVSNSIQSKTSGMSDKDVQNSAQIEMSTKDKPHSEWEAAEKQLSRAGVSRVRQAVSMAQASGLKPAELSHLADVLEHNSDTLKPGALIARLRDGVWPIDGIAEDPAEIEKAHQSAVIGRERAAEQKADVIRSRTIREARGRKQRPNRQVLLAVIAARLTAEGLERFATDEERNAKGDMEDGNSNRIKAG